MAKKRVVIIGGVVAVVLISVALHEILSYYSAHFSLAGCQRKTDEHVTITVTPDGDFSPSCLIVSSGTTLTWSNQSDHDVEVASDPHPTHSINRDISNDNYTELVPKGASEATVLNKRGRFSYHDDTHLGKIGHLVVD